MAVNEELPADAGQDAINELQGIRQSIDNIDAALIHLLAERFKFTQSVGRLKAQHGLPPADPAREFLQIQRLRGLAEDARLDPAFAEKFLNFIIAEVIHHHEKIAGDSGGARTAGTSASRPAAATPPTASAPAETDAPAGSTDPAHPAASA
ncbi:chorismate mutase [Cryobacterium adonitolivorans]|uniref:Chorismate mutase n=1 Tax=Cryobacterium adonitolivorans TaxID=1259189 RepID=A0A4R8W9G8_9MICO|nr:chorismate mutase [Cryobacterium adonitolivorans]TFC02056.1 chorismate mutase [Cryobacterium adonitolivorans]